MNRLRTNLSLAATVLFLAGCGSGAGAPAGGDASAALVKAGEALQAKLGAPGEKADMPAADDPLVKAFDVQAERGLVDLGTPAMPVDGLDSYDRLCGSAAQITAAYVAAGTGATGSGGLPMDDKVKVARMTENANRYMKQIFSPLLYSAHCTAVHLPSIEKSLAGQDLSGKAEAVGQIRNGAFGQVNGLLQMAGSSDLDAAGKKKVLDLLARDAGGFAAGLTQAQRQQLAQTAQQLGQSAPETKAQADGIAAALRQAPCGKLCSL